MSLHVKTRYYPYDHDIKGLGDQGQILEVQLKSMLNQDIDNGKKKIRQWIEKD